MPESDKYRISVPDFYVVHHTNNQHKMTVFLAEQSKTTSNMHSNISRFCVYFSLKPYLVAVVCGPFYIYVTNNIHSSPEVDCNMSSHSTCIIYNFLYITCLEQNLLSTNSLLSPFRYKVSANSESMEK